MGERARAAVPRKTPKVRLTRQGRSPPATAPAPAAPAPAPVEIQAELSKPDDEAADEAGEDAKGSPVAAS